LRRVGDNERAVSLTVVAPTQLGERRGLKDAHVGACASNCPAGIEIEIQEV
jgi:hypothetical protein